jgi:hypothetical protein
MPKIIESDPTELEDNENRISSDRISDLEAYLTEQVEDAISARHSQEREWIENLRQYEAVPKDPVRNTPVEGREVIETALGAIATDAIYAQELSLIFGISPILTVRATNKEYTDHAKAIQRLVNFLVASKDAGFRTAIEESFLDKAKLGTCGFYIPYVQRRKRTKTARVLTHGPKARSIAPEDLLAPGGAYHDLEDLPWAGIRQWYSASDLMERGNLEKPWKVDFAKPAAAVDWVRRQRESLGQTHGETSRRGDIFETWLLWAEFDLNDDGLDEDLFLAFDRTSRKVLKFQYNPYDRIPLVVSRYMRRGKLFYGKGVMSITAPNQKIATDTMNYWLDNAFLANIRMWIGDPTSGIGGTLHAWPGRVVSGDPDSLKPLVLADVYPSMPQLFQANLLLTERLTGIDSLTQSPIAALGKRTPATTAATAVQNQNKRFAPIFDAGRTAAAEVAMQYLYRYQERLLIGDNDAEEFIRRILAEEADLAIKILRTDEFDESIQVELTASSAQVNKELDRQNMILLAQLIGSYYERTLQLVMLANNPQIPQGVVGVINQITHAWGELIDRTLRTFDQVRDPGDFIIDLDNALQRIEANSTPDDLQAFLNVLNATGGQGEGEQESVAF